MSTMNVLIFASLMTFPSLSSSAPAGEKKSEETYRVCQEPVCFERARMINDSLNTSVNPCDDFYAYACGGWIAKHPIPESKSSIGNFDLVDDELQKTLKNILGNMTLVQQNQNITDKLAAAYNACLVVPTKGDQVQVLRRLMNDSGFDQWPKMSAQGRTASNLGNCTHELANIPIHDLLTMYVDRDLKELTTYVIQMDQLDFPMVGRNQLIHPNDTDSEKIIAAYKELVKTALKLMRKSSTEEELSKLAYDLVDFEGQLANLTTPPEERRDFLDLYHRTNISELEEKYPNVPLLNMLNNEFSHVNITLNESETIELFADDYYDKLNDFLEDVDCDMLYNYAGLRQILGWAGRASVEFRNASLNLTKASTGIAADQQAWEKCVSAMNDLMPEIVGYVYVLDKFSIQAKEEVEDLVKRIKTVFNDTIMQSDWMDNETKSAAEQKLEKMSSKIGYPKWLMNTTYLEQLYKYVPNLDPTTSFLEMYDHISENNWMRHLLQLGQKYDVENTWIVGPAVVNAFYNPSTNEMLYPSGILQGVFYQYGLPRSLNFGAIGMVVGHEMTHGFDDTGSQFDAHGALQQWWTNETRAKFDKKAQCFEWQYGNITDQETNTTLNGVNTVGENIADNGGMRMAYKAYNKLLEDECGGEDTRLPGLEHLSGRHLFFLSEAMMWCDRMRPERRKLLIQYDTHSPEKYRVNMPMRNMEEFATVFKCQDNSTMNPSHRCLLW